MSSHLVARIRGNKKKNIIIIIISFRDAPIPEGGVDRAPVCLASATTGMGYGEMSWNPSLSHP